MTRRVRITKLVIKQLTFASMMMITSLLVQRKRYVVIKERTHNGHHLETLNVSVQLLSIQHY